MEILGADIGSVVLYVFLFILGIGLLKGTFFQVEQQNVGIVQRLGKYKRIAQAGLNTKVPIIEKVAGRLSIRIQQMKVNVESITKDKVTVVLDISVQYKVLEEVSDIRNAFYKLTDAHAQINSYVFDIVRAKVPTMILDEVFERKEDIASEVKTGLNKDMNNYGYSIITALVTGIEPNVNVKAAMNEINTNERLKKSNELKGEAEKILIIKHAQAEKTKMELYGGGIANQRKAIVQGYKEAIKDFAEQIDADEREVAAFVLATNWMDTMKEVSGKSESNIILLPWSPTTGNNIADMIQQSILVGNAASKKLVSKKNSGEIKH